MRPLPRLRLLMAASSMLVALASASSARATGVDPAVATPVQREQAQGRFARGKQLFAAKKYQEALVEFRGSHDIVSSPNARFYVARCYRELGQFVAAYAELGRVLAEANEHARSE